RLVSFGEGRPNTRRRQTRGQLAAGIDPAGFAAVLGPLIDARLVTVDADDQVDLGHEVLIAAWPSFAAWIESRRADEQRRRQIQAGAEAWIARGRGAAGLLDAAELATALVWRTTDAARELGESAEVSQLIAASRRALTRARWLRRFVAAAAVILALVIGRLIQLSASATDEAARQAELAAAARTQESHARGEQYRELGRQALVDGHPLRAIPMLVAAREHGLDDPPLRMMFHAARPTAIEHSWPGGASVIAYSPDGRELAIAGEHGVQRRDAATGAATGAPLPHPGYVNLIAYAPDGRRLVTMIAGRPTAWLWDLATASARELTHDGALTWIQVSSDGTRVITASRDHTVRLWDGKTGAPAGRFELGLEVRSAELSRDHTRLAAVLASGTRVVWNTQTGKPLPGIGKQLDRLGNYVQSARFSPDGSALVTASLDGKVERWQVNGDFAMSEPIAAYASDAMFSPDGRRVLTVGDQALQLWDSVHNTRLAARTFSARLAFARFSRDGSRVLVVSDDRTVRVWTPATDRLDAIELEADPADADLSPDGSRVATAGQDAARVWQLSAVASRPITPPGVPVYDVAFSPDGRWLATGDSFGRVTLRRPDGAAVRVLDAQLPLANATFDAAGDRLLISAASGLARMVELASLTIHASPGGPAEHGSLFDDKNIYGHPPATAAISADGHRIAMLGDRAARVWDADTGLPVTPPLPHAAELRAIRFSPDAARVATAAQDGTVQLWDARTGARLGAAMTHAAPVYAIELGPDGRTLAAISQDARVTLWDIAGAPRRRFAVQHAERVIAAAFSPDGTRLLTYGTDHAAKVLDLATGLPAIPELHQDDGFSQAAFSPDGTRIMTVATNWVQLWDASTGRALGPPLAHPRTLRAAAFSPDGNTLVTAAADGARLWDIGLDNRSLAEWQRTAAALATP
ncbi:MAG TPA: WD40 repeat domain-containing protein, partial [Kofleriaceae bacterium]